ADEAIRVDRRSAPLRPMLTRDEHEGLGGHVELFHVLAQKVGPAADSDLGEPEEDRDQDDAEQYGLAEAELRILNATHVYYRDAFSCSDQRCGRANRPAGYAGSNSGRCMRGYRTVD